MTPALATPSTFANYRWVRKFTVDEYHRMIDANILGEDDAVELLEGYLVFKFPDPKLKGPLDELRPFSVAEYHRLIDVGILDEDDAVELIEGHVVLKMPRNPRHDGSVDLSHKAIGSRLPTNWWLRIQQAISLGEGEPEPDCAVVRGNERSYLQRHPDPADIGMVAEISESTLERDRGEKQRMYARANVAVYWIVNLVDNCVEVYTQPTGPTDAPRYLQHQVYRAGDSVPLVLDGAVVATIPAADLLP